MGGILRKTGNVAAPYSERFGKQFGGLATLAAFLVYVANLEMKLQDLMNTKTQWEQEHLWQKLT